MNEDIKPLYKKRYRRTIERQSLTVSLIEAATILGVSRATVYNLLKQNKLRAHKLGSRTIILTADIRKFISKLPLYTYEPRK
jgi:excisionase family DNA binding protein